MSILAIIALTVLVMVAGGYYVGRLRAVRAVSGETVRLHSLPNYHGYYVAIWTGLPAFLLILAFSVFGAGVIERLTFEELRREAAPLTQQLDAALASDAVYQDEQARIAALQGRARAVSAEMSDLRSARGEARDPDRLAALRAGLLSEQSEAVSPAVGRALEMADAYLFLALGYLGHTDELFPGESAPEAPPP